MSARITGDTIGAKELLAMAGEMATVHEREGRARNCLQRAAETVTSLATRLAEAERERDAAKTNADAVWAMAVSGSGGVRCTWCGLVDLSEVQGREHTKSCPKNPMVADLARLRPLAADMERLRAVAAEALSILRPEGKE